MSEETIKNERRLISIFLQDLTAVVEWETTNLKIEKFETVNQIILRAIMWASSSNSRLTEESFEIFLRNQGKAPNEIVAEKRVFRLIHMQAAPRDDMAALIEQVEKQYVERQTNLYLDDYRKARTAKGLVQSNQELAENLLSLESQFNERKNKVLDLATCRDHALAEMERKKNDKRARLLTGIKDIDDTMQVGMGVGKLTLIGAPPSSHKTNTMLNIAYNVFDKFDENVLYFSLEMDPDALLWRILARTTRTDLAHIEKPELQTKEETEKLDEALKAWQSRAANRFRFIRPGERCKVSLMRAEIKKSFAWFKPRLVVIDYMYNVIPEHRSNKRSDEEINGILDELRIMGGNFGFHVLTAAALTRDSIKRLREQKQGQETADSGDIMGGQVFAADADNLYVQIKDPQRQSEQLVFMPIKCREGKTEFENGSSRAMLRITPKYALVESAVDIMMDGGTNETFLDRLGQDLQKPPEDDDIGAL